MKDMVLALTLGLDVLYDLFIISQLSEFNSCAHG
jgi:hypothetical protein